MIFKQLVFEKMGEAFPWEVVSRLYKKISAYSPLTAFDDTHPCVFVLSTGRVGTKTLASLFG